MAAPETWAIVFGAVPGYLAILGGLYTFLSSRGKEWVREFLMVDDLTNQHAAQARRLDSVRSELQAMKAVVIAQSKTINALAVTLGSNVEGIEPEDVPRVKTGPAEEALYDDNYSASDFMEDGGAPGD